MRYLCTVTLAAAVLFFSACAYTPIKRVDPGSPITLKKNEGLLVIHTQSSNPILRLDLNGGRKVEDIKSGNQIVLVRIAAGQYHWRQINFRWSYLALSKDERWNFEVKPGQINYPGKLVAMEARSNWYFLRNINQSAMMFESLRKDFPDLVHRYPAAYTGFSRDEFLPYYQQELLSKTSPPIRKENGPIRGIKE